MAKCPNDQANKNKNENQDSTKDYIISTETEAAASREQSTRYLLQV